VLDVDVRQDPLGTVPMLTTHSFFVAGRSREHDECVPLASFVTNPPTNIPKITSNKAGVPEHESGWVGTVQLSVHGMLCE
jgi:hypothetical protein